MSIRQAAELVRSKGRDEDTVLIHMTPGEVKGLQAIALAHGGSLTINPETGLPEAGFLKSLLPMIAGAAAMMIPGMQPMGAALLVGAGSTGIGLAKGKGLGSSLTSGLMAGLGAYGGGSMAAGFGLGSAGEAASKAVADKATEEAAKKAAGEVAKGATQSVVSNPFSNSLANLGSDAAAKNAMQSAFTPGVTNAAGEAAAKAANAGLGGFGARFGEAARMGATRGGTNILGSYAPMAAATGVMTGLGGAMEPKPVEFPGMPQQPTYAGPYMPQPREVAFKQQSGVPMSDSSEFLYFPRSSSLSDRLNSLYAARGGEIGMKDGDFVLDARTVSEIGNGSSNAGKEVLARMGGIPIDGRGDGVSDSIRANIGGVQEARVARDEVIIPRERVQAMGGSKQLYNLMNRAHEARRVADRGEDTGLARGLMAV
jgi:hypothetical protein